MTNREACGETGMHRMRDGVRLHVAWHEPGGQVRGVVLLTHGMGEHARRYGHVIERLTQAGLRVMSWDLRGHGRSEGPRGDIASYEALVDDLAEMWGVAYEAARAAGGGRVFLYGHSLGGQLSLNFAASRRPDAAGLVITSPWLRLAFDPPRWKVAVAQVAAHIWPGLTQDTGVQPGRLSRDLQFLDAMPDLHLVHHRMSARMYEALMAGARSAAELAPQLPYPALLVHGDADPVTSVAATQAFFHGLPVEDKELLIVPGALHETHNDTCRGEVLERITAWVRTHSSPLFASG